MIRSYDAVYKIDGTPLLTPDEDVEVSLSDLDASDSGRDESGIMHRIVVREKVKTFGFAYAVLDSVDYVYLLNLFAGKQTFTLSYPENGAVKTCTAYCSKVSGALHNQKTGLYKNLKFNIIEC